MGTSSAYAAAGINNDTGYDTGSDGYTAPGDWRVRLALAAEANYLYKDDTNTLLAPLAYTDGVIFPYTPAINVSYNATYDTTSPVHSNYNVYSYTKSSVENINITCDFTAQDEYEANYLLATIHFFRSLTKMFYGQEQLPKPGTPPPMVFLYGLGQFQFSGQPLVINSFNYSLPNGVDYIRASGITTSPSSYIGTATGTGTGTGTGSGGTAPKSKAFAKLTKDIKSAASTAFTRLAQGAVANLNGSVVGGLLGNLLPGGVTPGSATVGSFQSLSNPGIAGQTDTYVPTQIQLQISCLPAVSRYKQTQFSFKDYANGNLIKGGYW